MEQDKNLMYHVEMFESTPLIELMFRATVPMPCPGCSLTMPLTTHAGLTVSDCSLTILTDTNTTLSVRPVPTAGRNARIVSLEFGPVVTRGSPWHRFKLHRILVCSVSLIVVFNVAYNLHVFDFRDYVP